MSPAIHELHRPAGLFHGQGELDGAVAAAAELLGNGQAGKAECHRVGDHLVSGCLVVTVDFRREWRPLLPELPCCIDDFLLSRCQRECR
jgi:hypothetical protein